MYTPEERERRKALLKYDNVCARCKRAAWSLSLEAAMQLRPKWKDPEKKELVCGECCKASDAAAVKKAQKKERRRRRKARRSAAASSELEAKRTLRAHQNGSAR